MTIQVTNLVNEFITLTSVVSGPVVLAPFQTKRFEMETVTTELATLDSLKQIQAEVVSTDVILSQTDLLRLKAVADNIRDFLIADARAKFSLRGTPYASIWQGTDRVLNQYVRSGVSSSIHDYQGYLQIIRANEIGYEGLRRVENLCPDARNMTTGWTLDTNTFNTDRAYIGGSPTANKGVLITRPAASTVMLTMNSQSYEPDMHVASGKFAAISGTVVLRIQCIRSGDNAVVATRDITLSTTYARRGISFTPLDTSNHRITLGLVSGTGFGMDEWMVERKADQVPHPSEFVTRGEAGTVWPFQGAGVDGVQYFDTLPYCFLESDGNIFEFADRVQISESVFKGVRRPPAATQRPLQTVDLTAITATTASTATPWLKTNLGDCGSRTDHSKSDRPQPLLFPARNSCNRRIRAVSGLERIASVRPYSADSTCLVCSSRTWSKVGSHIHSSGRRHYHTQRVVRSRTRCLGYGRCWHRCRRFARLQKPVSKIGGVSAMQSNTAPDRLCRDSLSVSPLTTVSRVMQALRVLACT